MTKQKMTPAQAGALGGKKRNPNKGFGSLSKEERSAMSRAAALAYWEKKRGTKTKG